MNDLNTRLQDHIPISRFRPNVVLEAPRPYWEDEVDSSQVRGSNIVFQHTKGVKRCKIITIDQESGEKKSTEPLKVLHTYRPHPKKGEPLFCQKVAIFIPDDQGQPTIRVGDTLEALTWKDPTRVLI